MDPLLALTSRLKELDLMGPPDVIAEQLYTSLARSGWKLIRFTDHDKLNQQAWDALSKEMGGNA